MGDAIYVAVNEIFRESENTLLWTLKTRKFNKIFLLHVHIPCSLTTTSSGLPQGELPQGEIDAIKNSDQTLSHSLDKYRDICINKGVNKERVGISLILGDDVAHVGEGIVKLINQKNIKKLVMGAAADSHYSSGMCIKSRTAKHVLTHAPNSCKIRFICKGKLIKTSNGSKPEPPQESKKTFEESKKKTSEEKIKEIHYLKNMIGCVVVMVLVYMFLFEFSSMDG